MNIMKVHNIDNNKARDISKRSKYKADYWQAKRNAKNGVGEIKQIL